MMSRIILILSLVWLLTLDATHAQESRFPVITPENAHLLEQVGTLGRGITVDVRYVDNDTIETVAYGGLWRYDANNLDIPSQWVDIPQPELFYQYSSDGHWMLTNNGELWDIGANTGIATFDTFAEHADFSQDSHLLAYYERIIRPESNTDCLADNSCIQDVILWDTLEREPSLEFTETGILDVEFVLNDTLLAVIQNEQTTLYDVATGNQVTVIPAQLRIFSPDGSKGLSFQPAHEESGVEIQVWDIALQIVVLHLTFLPEEAISNTHFSDDGILLAISTIIRNEDDQLLGGTIAVWDIAARNRAATFPHDEASFGFAISPNNRYLATVNYELFYGSYGQPTITLFDLQTLRIQASIPNEEWRRANAVAFSPDSGQLV